MLTIKIIQASNPIALYNFLAAVREITEIPALRYSESEEGRTLEIPVKSYSGAQNIAHKSRSMARVYNHEIEIEFKEVF